jgi:hypothetical protein
MRILRFANAFYHFGEHGFGKRLKEYIAFLRFIGPVGPRDWTIAPCENTNKEQNGSDQRSTDYPLFAWIKGGTHET